MRFATFTIILLLSCTLIWAETAGLNTRIYPEKNTYLLGEPIFLNMEIVNNSSRPIQFDGSYGRCSRDMIKVQGAQRHSPDYNEPTCGYGGFVGNCSTPIGMLPPGEKRIGKIFLNGLFSFDNPDKYHIKAGADNFDISVVQGMEAQLKAAFDQYVQELPDSEASLLWNPTGMQRSQAIIEGITRMAPPFLEDVILRLSYTEIGTAKTIPALGRLNTERTRKRLLELAERGNHLIEINRALAQTREPSILAKMTGYMQDRRIVDNKSYYTWYYFLWNIGLFGEDAIPCLTTALEDPDKKQGAIRGLGASGCREAVPILIEQLEKSSGNELSFIREGLAQLTHLADGGFVKGPILNPDEYLRWREWWELNEATAEIFDTDHCSKLEPLP